MCFDTMFVGFLWSVCLTIMSLRKMIAFVGLEPFSSIFNSIPSSIFALCLFQKVAGKWLRLWEHYLRVWSNFDTRRRFHVSPSRGMCHV